MKDEGWRRTAWGNGHEDRGLRTQAPVSRGVYLPVELDAELGQPGFHNGIRAEP